MQNTVPQLLEEIQQKYPHLRHGQIIVNALRLQYIGLNDLFGINDEQMRDALEKFLAQVDLMNSRNHHE